MSSDSPQSRDLKADAQLIEKSGYFDAKWYCQQYPDVKKLGLDPATHFLKYGWRLNRNPSEKFHMRSYLERYPDVQTAGVNPLLHFLEAGQREGRTAPVVPLQLESVSSSDLRDASLAIAKSVEHESRPESPEGQIPTVEEQLAETQRLLEHYFVQYENLRFAMLDQKNIQETNPST